MIRLYSADNSVWDDYRPKHAAENAVDHETDAADHIDNSNLFQIAQYKT